VQTSSLVSRQKDTIVALSSAPGVGAIALIRLSGSQAIDLVQQIFKGKDLRHQPTNTVHFGTLHQLDGQLLDEVVVSLFRAPKSYTREDVVEIGCHGSPFIVQQILQTLLDLGARTADPGEFTQRAFLNGSFDLAQAEAIADLIAADSAAAHRVALFQLRGGLSKQIKLLREQIIQFAALLELELDFAEEDVEFANRSAFKLQLTEIQVFIEKLLGSFRLGNALKKGIPVAIVGQPNAGKSTLLNALLQEEKAIVTDIPGTTRDAIEDECVIQGIRFRFIDTAGLRETTDPVEILGIARTKQKMIEAALIIYLFDLQLFTVESLTEVLTELQSYQVPVLLVGNKCDQLDAQTWLPFQALDSFVPIAALTGFNLPLLSQRLLEVVQADQLDQANAVVLSNARHYESLQNTLQALKRVQVSLEANSFTELITSDLREAIHHLSAIIGEVTQTDLLSFIFSKFCIGK